MTARVRTRCGRVMAIVATLFSFAIAHASDDYALPPDSRVPGGLAVIRLGAGEHSPGAVYFGAHRAPVTHDGTSWAAIVGIPLATPPGPHAAVLVSRYGRMFGTPLRLNRQVGCRGRRSRTRYPRSVCFLSMCQDDCATTSSIARVRNAS